MNTSKKIFIGGLGALTPIIINLLAIDFETICKEATIWACIGYTVRIVILFYLGGLIAFLHKSENDFVKLFQLGIGAPALVTLWISGANVKDENVAAYLNLSTTYAYAASASKDTFSLKSAPTKENNVEQFFRGLSGRKIRGEGILSKGTTFFAGSREGMAFESSELGHGIFTWQLIKGLEGGADISQNGAVTIAELGGYLSSKIPELSLRMKGYEQIPLIENSNDIITQLSGPNSILKDAFVISVGINDYLDKNVLGLQYSISDAQAFAELMRQIGANVTLILNEDATYTQLKNVLEMASTQINENTSFVLYFSGYSVVGQNGYANFVLHDSSVQKYTNLLSLNELKSYLSKLSSKNILLFIDSSLSNM